MKKIINFLILLFFIYITLQVFLYSNNVTSSIIFAITIFKNNIFPSLFPFFVLSELLINYRLVEYLNLLLGRLMNKVFKINGSCSFIFFLSMLTGFPSSAKYTKELYEKGYIDLISSTKILAFTHFSNPLFIIGYVGGLLGFKTAIYILIIHYITNIILGIFIRNKFISNYMTTMPINDVTPLGIVLKNSIQKSIDTLLMILGTIAFFVMLNSIITELPLPNILKFFSNCFLEMTSGIYYVSSLSFSMCLKSALICMILSFGGLSVHFQIISIIGNTKIKYQPYLIARIFHALLAGLLVFLTYNLI